MKVTLTQSGGYAGLIRTARLDTSQLPPDEAARLVLLVREALAVEAPERSRAPCPDAIEYEIEVEDDGRVASLTATDANEAPAVRELVKWLRTKATAGRP